MAIDKAALQDCGGGGLRQVIVGKAMVTCGVEMTTTASKLPGTQGPGS